MATRRERVILELEDQFTGGLARAAVAARMFQQELDRVNTTGGPGFTRTAVTIERDANKVGTSIDRLSGRLALILKGVAALGPGAVPITTTLIPALAGLTTQFGFVVAGAGATVLALNGVGDSLKALNKFELEPTEANLAKVREEFDRLGPSASAFVFALRDMGPEFRAVKDAAAEGLIEGGLMDSLDQVELLLPRLADIASEVTGSVGALADQGATSLAGPEWEEFFAFIEREARPTLTRLGQSIGNISKGLAEMWMAFDPLSDDFQDGLVSATQAFEDWAEGLTGSEDFQEFLNYVQDNGPQALETIGSIADMFLQVVEAAAPLGGPVLQVLETIADIVATIADSDLGTPIIAAVSALSALNLAQTTFTRTRESAFGTKAVSGVTGFTNALLTVTSATDRATMSTAQLAKVEQERQAQVRTGLAKTGLLLGGLAAVGTGAADSVGLTQTASLGLIGTMAVGGPWGTALGAGAGYLLDIKSAGNDVEDTIRSLSRELEQNATNFAAHSEIVDKFRDEYLTLSEDLAQAQGFKPSNVLQSFDPDVLKDLYDQIVGNKTAQEQLNEAWVEAELRTDGYRAGLDAVGEALGQDLIGPMTTQTEAVDALTTIYERAQPAMQQMGISLDDLAAAWQRDHDARRDFLEGGGSPLDFVGELDTLAARIADYATYADTAAGRTEAVQDALAGLDNQLGSTEEAAATLNDTLSQLIDPKLNLSEARLAWREALRGIEDDLHSVTNAAGEEVPGSRELFGGGEGADTNLAAMNDRVEILKDSLVAMAAVPGTTSESVVAAFRKMRDQLIQTAVDAGLAEKDVRALLKQYGLTPANIRTNFDANVEPAMSKLDRLQAKINTVTQNRRFSVHMDVTGGGPDLGNPAHFAKGGWTGHGGKYEPAGVVHKREFVVKAGPAESFRPLLEKINSLPGYANGGMVGHSVPAALGMDFDYARLAAVMANSRPLYGDVHLQPHNYSEFQREMSKDRQMAMSDGWGTR